MGGIVLAEEIFTFSARMSYLGWRTQGENWAHTCPGSPAVEAPLIMVFMGEHPNSKKVDEKEESFCEAWIRPKNSKDDDDFDDYGNDHPTLFLTLCPLNLLWSMYKSVIIPYSRSSLIMVILINHQVCQNYHSCHQHHLAGCLLNWASRVSAFSRM